MPNPDHEKNRIAWNEMVEVHWDHPDQKRKEFLEGRCSLKSIELDAIGDVTSKSLLHLMCQFGLGTLSWARRGAVVTGVDISDRAIARADELKQQAGLEGRFVRSDVLDLIGVLDDRFDIVFQSHGTHWWISDMDKWAQVIAHYLAPGGRFFIVDDHPIICVWLEPTNSYLHKGPIRYSGEPDYIDRDYIIADERVEFQHPLSQMVNALIKAGLRIEHLGEYDKGYYPIQADWVEKDRYWYPPDGPPLYPLMFSLMARKV